MYLHTSVACSATLGLAVLASTALRANNISVSQGSLDANTGTHISVKFDISWENSWRLGPERRDAAWVFVKYRTSNGPWSHVQLDSAGHVAPSGSTIVPGLLVPGSPYDATTNPCIGVFIERSADGGGTFSAEGVLLQWNYGAAGVDIGDVEEVRVFAIEMVYVPEGSFQVGSGGTENGSFTDGAWTSGPTIPYQITSEAAITIGPSAGNLWGTSNSGLNSIGGAGTLPAAFPKGFKAFYCMKYEIAQQQYVDFLNTLTRTQQNTRTGTELGVGITNVTNRCVMSNSSSNNARNGIRCNASIPANDPIVFYCDANGNGIPAQEDDGLWIACNWMNMGDQTAYLDWSGLRIMTELEYEKACRGPISPVAGEFPWGTATIANAIYGIVDTWTASERITDNYTTVSGNALHISTNGVAINGPIRSGIFAASGGNNGRSTSGASYYGIMEMGGNLWERPVSLGIQEGRSYTGSHGNGTLDPAGNSDVPTWPGVDSIGTGVRGGSWNQNADRIRVSDRVNAIGPTPNRILNYGSRGVRGMP